jgi:hypothetical protein
MKCIKIMCFLSVLVMCGNAGAELIPISNPSFEDPDVPGYQYAPINGWNTLSGYEGVIDNGFSGILWLDDCDGSQMAFLPAYRTYLPDGIGLIYQDLTTTFEAGNTYTLTVALGLFDHEGSAPGSTMECRLHYRGEDPNAAPAAATMTIAWDDLNKDAFQDFSTSVTVHEGDPMVGCTMGVSLWGHADGPNVDYAIDNIRLTVEPIPEPSCVALIFSGIVGLGALNWRKFK